MSDVILCYLIGIVTGLTVSAIVALWLANRSMERELRLMRLSLAPAETHPATITAAGGA